MVADVHLVAGSNGYGKTTWSRRLERTLPGVRFSLDEWMLRLHGVALDPPSYPRLADGCRELIWDIAAQVLRADIAVILDWNMWSRERRADGVRRAADLGSQCQLPYVDVSLDTAIQRAGQCEDPAAHRLDEASIRHLSTLSNRQTNLRVSPFTSSDRAAQTLVKANSRRLDSPECCPVGPFTGHGSSTGQAPMAS